MLYYKIQFLNDDEIKSIWVRRSERYPIRNEDELYDNGFPYLIVWISCSSAWQYWLYKILINVKLLIKNLFTKNKTKN